MTSFKCFFILLAVVMAIESTGLFSVRKADAAAALLAPAAAIGSLELASGTLTLAVGMGVITVAQNRQMQAQIAASIKRIETATADAIDAVVDDSLILLKTVAKATRHCLPTSSTEARHANCNQTPEACCADYLSKFSANIEKGHGGIKIYKGKGKNKLLCCLEWDHTHGGFEIFDEHGRHMGERGCDDMNDDPCSRTESRGRHAKPNTTTHHPRTGACRK